LIGVGPFLKSLDQAMIAAAVTITAVRRDRRHLLTAQFVSSQLSTFFNPFYAELDSTYCIYVQQSDRRSSRGRKAYDFASFETKVLRPVVLSGIE
jgi:hypothetical protein